MYGRLLGCMQWKKKSEGKHGKVTGYGIDGHIGVVFRKLGNFEKR